MGYFFIFLLGALIFSANGRVARSRNRSPLIWGLISLVAFFLFYGILGSFYIGAVYKGPMTPEGLAAFIQANPLSGLLVLLFGFGGVLAVRFYLERLPVDNGDEE